MAELTESPKQNHPALTLNDKLAIERTHLANERTFLAYFRTSVVFLSSGIVILRITILEDLVELGVGLLIIAPIILIYGILQFIRIRRKVASYYRSV